MSLHGIWAAVLTPVNARLEPDAPKAIEYYAALLANGCDGLNVLGTTGEASSFGISQRLRFMEALAGSSLPRERMMVGTGATSVEDAAVLTKAAFACRFAAALLLPPFFFRDVPDDGVLRFFDTFFARVNPPPQGVILYNFPARSGVTFHAGLVDALIARFPTLVGGMKDSSNDPRLQRELLVSERDFAVFPSSEEYLLEAQAYGAAGCISGSVALWPQRAKSVLETRDEAQAARLAALRRAVSGPGADLLLRVRYLTAKQRDDESWERPMPPLSALSAQQRKALDDLLPQSLALLDRDFLA
ncbi:MAG: dihydrodipicolinate synthase family protein [Candidatus Eremiobacteraeota bacterium]|nr:dihydrodipicolinate synthase family protein [Candidatus Eremiobacteraeota bacterium]